MFSDDFILKEFWEKLFLSQKGVEIKVLDGIASGDANHWKTASESFL